ncbi:MAG: hypothetical protein K2X77_14225 [Candidatus Obscuribacterales bacterium]|jgi:hypothetical protein|nr:hypothetical protein [Candidatus Obscuribacterales bacterium]
MRLLIHLGIIAVSFACAPMCIGSEQEDRQMDAAVARRDIGAFETLIKGDYLNKVTPSEKLMNIRMTCQSIQKFIQKPGLTSVSDSEKAKSICAFAIELYWSDACRDQKIARDMMALLSTAAKVPTTKTSEIIRYYELEHQLIKAFFPEKDNLVFHEQLAHFYRKNGDTTKAMEEDRIVVEMLDRPVEVHDEGANGVLIYKRPSPSDSQNNTNPHTQNTF